MTRAVATGRTSPKSAEPSAEPAKGMSYFRASEMPLYRIVKDITLARRQGAYAVIAQSGMILRRGHDLAQVLRVLLGKPRLVTV